MGPDAAPDPAGHDRRRYLMSEDTEHDIGEKDAGSMPTAEEEAAAERAAKDQPDVEETYRDMTEKGAHSKGEGSID